MCCGSQRDVLGIAGDCYFELVAIFLVLRGLACFTVQRMGIAVFWGIERCLGWVRILAGSNPGGVLIFTPHINTHDMCGSSCGVQNNISFAI